MTSDPFASNAPMLSASILSADFTRLGAEIDDALSGGADFLHLDVMDGHFVPNITFGIPLIKAARKATRAFLDCHLMISDPVGYARPMIEAGADLLTFHLEAVQDPTKAAREIRRLGARVGVSIKPKTDVQLIWPVLDVVDMVLVMSVEPGFSGQAFMPEVLPKCEAVKQRLGPGQRLEIDGGIGPETIASAASAGVDWFVAASAIFGANDRGAAIRQLRGKIGGM